MPSSRRPNLLWWQSARRWRQVGCSPNQAAWSRLRTAGGDPIPSATLNTVLEATGYLDAGEPAAGVIVGEGALVSGRGRNFVPDAMWRSPTSVTVYFKYELTPPSSSEVASWRREVWNEGFAPLLWVVSPDRIDLYNGFGRPVAGDDAETHLLRTFETIERELEKLDTFAGRLAMETGQFWLQANAVSRQTSVARQLLSDLAALERDLVADGLDRSATQALIGRLIFTQYLIDRGIVGQETLERQSGARRLPDVLRHRTSADRLFRWLADVFNGDMFAGVDGTDVASEEHLARAADFLEAVDPETGQTSLFPYQFDIIPVELISSIYEQFCHSDTGRQESDGESPGTSAEARRLAVHYTRLPVVSLVLDEIMNGLTGSETVLDLTCGSGVFLVEAFRRLVALRGGATPARSLIRSTLYEQICGVDISESAIRIAAFSLYLAALELDPDPQPPEALTFEALIGRALIVGDALDVDATPAGARLRTRDGLRRRFDVIVGNPPWTFHGSTGTTERQKGRKPDEPRQPRGEALDFVLRATDFGDDRTRYGIVLSAPPFFAGSRTGAAAALDVIERLSPVTLVNLTSMASWLFPTAKMPAMILLARARPQPAGVVTIVNVPWSPASERSLTFAISPGDIVALTLASWRDDSTRLKTAAFGRGRDASLLDHLRSNHGDLALWLASIGSSLRDGLILGAVGQRTRDARHLKGLELLQAQDLQSFQVPSELHRFDDELAQWPRSREIYRAPLLLVKEFLRGGPRPVAAVSDRDLVYTDAYFGASVGIDHADSASLVAAILSSSLASWFFLLTASEFGVWKRRLMTNDVRLLSLPDMTRAPTSPAGRRVLSSQAVVRSNPADPRAWAALDDAVLTLYGLDPVDRVVIADGFARASWQWQRGRSESAAPADLEADLMPYARTFLRSIDAWLQTIGQRRMRAEVFSLPKWAPLRVIRFSIESEPGPSVVETVRPQRDLAVVLEQIGKRLGVRLGAYLVGERELRVHGESELVVIKPVARRFWMRARAVEDADSVIAESFTRAAAT
jgi:N-6 DNA Methylase